MYIDVPLENQEIPQTGVSESWNSAGSDSSENGWGSKTAMKERTGKKITGLSSRFNETSRESEVRWNAEEDSEYYSYHFFTDAADPDGSSLRQGITTRCMVSYGGHGQKKLFFRVRTIGFSGLGSWSDAHEVTLK